MSTAELRSAAAGTREDECFRRSPGVLERSIPGVAVLLLVHPDEEVVVLAGTGMALWEELAEPTRLDQVAVRLALRYGVAPDAVVDSVAVTLDALQARGAVERCDR